MYSGKKPLRIQGMTVDSYKKMVKLEAENEALHKAREEAERKNQKDAVIPEVGSGSRRTETDVSAVRSAERDPGQAFS